MSAASGIASALAASTFAQEAQPQESSATSGPGDEDQLRSPEARALLSSLRTHCARPQRLSELLFPHVFARRAERRAAAREQLLALLAKAERGGLGSGDVGEGEAVRIRATIEAAEGLLGSCLSAAEEKSDGVRIAAAEAQEAHMRFVGPLVQSSAGLSAFSAELRSAPAAPTEAALPEARFSESQEDLVRAGRARSDSSFSGTRTSAQARMFEVCAARYAADGRVIELVGSSPRPSAASKSGALTSGGLGDCAEGADAFGVPQQHALSFAARASAAQHNADSVAACLLLEAGAVSAEVSLQWSAAQRESTKARGALSKMLQARHWLQMTQVVDCCVASVPLAGAASLLEPHTQREVWPSLVEPDAFLEPVAASVPATIRLTVSSAGSALATADLTPEPKPAAAHVVVFVNGLGGTVHDTRLLRAHLKLRHPRLVCLATSSVQGAQTEADIVANADSIAREVDSFIRQRLPEDGLALGQLSFVGFSLGGVLARLAARSPLLYPHIQKCGHAFISLASPHLGVQYSKGLVSAGMFLVRQYKTSRKCVSLAFSPHRPHHSLSWCPLSQRRLPNSRFSTAGQWVSASRFSISSLRAGATTVVPKVPAVLILPRTVARLPREELLAPQA
jgi:hypothetical protein